MGHPNKRAVRKLRCYENIHDSWSLLLCSCDFTLLQELVSFYVLVLKVKIKDKSTL